MSFDKFASAAMEESFDLGFTLYGIIKQANAGSPEAQAFMKEAMEAGPMMDPGMMGGGGEAMPPAPMVMCPQHGGEVTPTPEGICPVCGFDFNTMAGEVAPDAGGIPAPTMEDLAAAEGQIKSAAINDPEAMRWLMVNFGDWTE